MKIFTVCSQFGELVSILGIYSSKEKANEMYNNFKENDKNNLRHKGKITTTEFELDALQVEDFE